MVVSDKVIENSQLTITNDWFLWSCLGSAGLFFIIWIVSSTSISAKNTGIIIDGLFGSWCLFFGYCLYSFTIFSPNKSKLFNGISALKSFMDENKEVINFFSDVWMENRNLTMLCIFLFITPISFFLYSVVVAVDLTRNNYEPKFLTSVYCWWLLFVVGALIQVYPSIKIVDLIMFTDNTALWVGEIQRRLLTASISLVAIAFCLSFFYKLINGYDSKFFKLINRIRIILEYYKFDMWKKRLAAIMASSSLYVLIAVWSPSWPAPFNLLAEWALFIAFISFWLLSWSSPLIGIIGPLWSGAGFSRSGKFEIPQHLKIRPMPYNYTSATPGTAKYRVSYIKWNLQEKVRIRRAISEAKIDWLIEQEENRQSLFAKARKASLAIGGTLVSYDVLYSDNSYIKNGIKKVISSAPKANKD